MRSGVGLKKKDRKIFRKFQVNLYQNKGETSELTHNALLAYDFAEIESTLMPQGHT